MKKPIPASQAWPMANDIAFFFKKRDKVVQICGSLRRGMPIVHDIDIMHNTTDVIAMSYCMGLGRVCVPNPENTKSSVIMDGVQVDLYSTKDENWGAMMLFLTGSKLLNIVMRSKAKKLGYKLNQYGVWHGQDLIAGKTEEQIFMVLGFEYLRPEERTLEGGHHRLVNI